MDQAELKRLLHYDPAKGVFTWRQTLSNRSTAGTVAGYLQPNGYVRIGIADVPGGPDAMHVEPCQQQHRPAGCEQTK